jgi:excisionase family DNA binding protein
MTTTTGRAGSGRRNAPAGAPEVMAHGPDRWTNAPPMNRGLLRVEEAAEWLGLGRTKAYELVYAGTLPSVTIGRSRRVPVAALEGFVARLMDSGGIA